MKSGGRLSTVGSIESILTALISFVIKKSDINFDIIVSNFKNEITKRSNDSYSGVFNIYINEN